MDPRGASALTNNPTSSLETLAESASASFPNLFAARQHTAERIADVKSQLADAANGQISVVVSGSWARAELTKGSDDDWAVIYEDGKADEASINATFEQAKTVLGGDGKEPGSQDIFGAPFAIEELVSHIGLDADTNTNLTRRLLLLLESVEVSGDAHTYAVRAVLEKYLNYGIKPFRPPRFLLNDLVRYWRTICVDFEGKHMANDGDDPKWVARNAKLRTSRKLLFTGGLLPILLCHLKDLDDMQEFLLGWFAAPPTDRLAATFLHVEAIEAGVRTLTAYDRWMAIMGSPDARAELKQLRQDTRAKSGLWHEIRMIGNEFERGLISLLFETRLAPLAQKYGLL